MAETIRVNFGRPMPLFPLPGSVLLPHAIQPLHIFEPRYRQMIEQSLDSSGQIAMASFQNSTNHFSEAESDSDSNHITIRPAVCIGQIVQHLPLPDGRHNILLQGICRAKIVKLIDPDEDRLYRMAMLEPLEPVQEPPPPLGAQRRRLRSLLSGPRLKRMRGVDKVMEWFEHREVPTHALLELIGFSLLHDDDLRYQLLAEANPQRRATIICRELQHLDQLLCSADRQPYRDWPKGMSWN